MRIRKQRPPAAPPPQEVSKPAKPPWHEFLDPMERPSREDRSADHNPFESILEPVPLPRWLRGRRRAPRDKLSP
jgi:hypothetical protein